MSMKIDTPSFKNKTKNVLTGISSFWSTRFYVTFYFARPNTFASFANSSKDNASPLTDGENPHSAIAASIVSFSKDNPGAGVTVGMNPFNLSNT